MEGDTDFSLNGVDFDFLQRNTLEPRWVIDFKRWDLQKNVIDVSVEDASSPFSWGIQEEENEEREPKPPSSLSNLVADGSIYVEYIDMLMVKERVDIIELLDYLISCVENNTTDNIVT